MKTDIGIKAIIYLTIVILDIAQSCTDTTDTIDVGWTFNPTCGEILAYSPDLCQTKNLVMVNCPRSCGTCGFDPYYECHETQGKFVIHSNKKTCQATSTNDLCEKKAFRFNCPSRCNVCSSNECSGEAPDCCMGLTNACELRIDELFFAAMHNANSDENHWNSNHEAPLEQALEAGFRSFYLDVCICKGKIVFCHGTCFWVGTQDPTEVFENIVQFLDNNPSEIVIFNFEISHGSPTPMQLWNVMSDVNGLQKKSYVHNGGTWPRLKNLLQDGKQIISLKHNGDNCLNTAVNGCTPFIQEFFKYTVGTKYHFEKISEIQNVQNSCVGERGTMYRKEFFAINNFITNSFPGPTEDAAMILNEKSFVEKRISDCESVMGRDANFVAVDFWQHGELPKIAKKINNDRGAAKLIAIASGSYTSSSSLIQNNWKTMLVTTFVFIIYCFD